MKRIIRLLAAYGFSLLSCFYLFIFGFIRSRHRQLLYQICKHFGFDAEFAAKPTLPKISLSEIVNDDVCVKLRESTVQSGNVSLIELYAINSLIVAHRPRAIFEIGTFDGRTTLNMASNAGDGCRVYTLDLPQEMLSATKLPIASGDREFINKKYSGARFKGQKEESRIVQLLGDSATFDFSPYNNTVDLVFIDGSHAYEYVLNDSKIALRLLRDGRGVILWHDFIAWEGVTRALNELYGQGEGDFKDIRHIEGTTLVCLVKT